MNTQLNIEEIKPFLREYVESITEPSKGKDMYICPLCGSGEGKNGTGAFSIHHETQWKCFACGEGGDILDLIGKHESIADKSAQIARACSFANSEIYPYQKQYKSERKKPSLSMTIEHNVLDISKDFFLQAHRNIGNTAYWQERGLSRAIVDRFNLGFVDAWRHPKVPNAPTSPRLIIPTGKASYLARDTRADIPEGARQYSKQKVGSAELFNIQALYEGSPAVFIVEGEIDALSIMEVGSEAIALGSVSMVKKFVAEVKKSLETETPIPAFYIALDSDERGQKASNELEGALKGLGLPCGKVDVSNGCKDPNDALTSDRGAFIKLVARVPQEQAEQENKKAEQEKARYLATSSSGFMQKFMTAIESSKDETFIPTGFPCLDTVLDGGLYTGLYVIGAISSLGKTTFMLQVADQAAQRGQDVLIFSLEMSRFEVMAKSVSRHTLARAGDDVSLAKTTRGVLSGRLYEGYSEKEKNVLGSALRDYAQYSKNVYVHEGMGNVGAEQVRETVKQHIHYTGKKPLVIIDYLQLLAPDDVRASDKQNTDKAVLELKRISRDFSLSVVGVSSFNRANYSTKVSFESFKESGAIEYSSDVLMGLQLEGAGTKDFDVTEAKSKEPREVELVILKNRNGRIPANAIKFKFYPRFNYFTDVPS